MAAPEPAQYADTESPIHHVVCTSSGAGSAMAGKLVAERYGTDNLTLLFADVNMEHPDNYRFLRESTGWIGGTLVTLDNGGRTIWDVFKEVRFLGNTRIDPCSRVLKREPMRKWLEDNCDPERTVVYLGFDWTEEHRVARAAKYWAPWKVESPMCWEPVMDKAEGMARMAAAGIEPPWLTRMGFPHANCGGGCVKAGIKQFQKLRKLSPEGYADWEWNEEQIRQFLDKDVTILRDRTGGKVRPLALRELRERDDATPGLFKDEDYGGCNCFSPPEDDEEAVGVSHSEFFIRNPVRIVDERTCMGRRVPRTHVVGTVLDGGWVSRCGVYLDTPDRVSDEPSCPDCRALHIDGQERP